MKNVVSIITKTGVGHIYGDVESPSAVIDGEHVSIVGLAHKLGAECEDWSVVTAFESAKNTEPENEECWGPHRADYAERTRRTHPKAYRIMVSVEVEELPDDEARAYWDARAERFRISDEVPA